MQAQPSPEEGRRQVEQLHGRVEGLIAEKGELAVELARAAAAVARLEQEGQQLAAQLSQPQARVEVAEPLTTSQDGQEKEVVARLARQAEGDAARITRLEEEGRSVAQRCAEAEAALVKAQAEAAQLTARLEELQKRHVAAESATAALADKAAEARQLAEERQALGARLEEAGRQLEDARVAAARALARLEERPALEDLQRLQRRADGLAAEKAELAAELASVRAGRSEGETDQLLREAKEQLATQAAEIGELGERQRTLAAEHAEAMAELALLRRQAGEAAVAATAMAEEKGELRVRLEKAEAELLGRMHERPPAGEDVRELLRGLRERMDEALAGQSRAEIRAVVHAEPQQAEPAKLRAREEEARGEERTRLAKAADDARAARDAAVEVARLKAGLEEATAALHAAREEAGQLRARLNERPTHEQVCTLLHREQWHPMNSDKSSSA